MGTKISYSERVEKSFEDSSLSDIALSEILATALASDRQLDPFDLGAMSRSSLMELSNMIEQELELRLPQIESEETPFPLLRTYDKSMKLSQLLRLEDDEVTTRQIALLTAMKAQIELEDDARVDKIMEAENAAFQKVLDEDSQQWDALHESIETEYGKDVAIKLNTLVRFGDSNIAPTVDRWGVMQVSHANDHDATMIFVREHADEALKIDDEINRRCSEVLYDKQTYEANFILMPIQPALRPVHLTPDQVFARAKEIKDALIDQGGCGQDKYPNLIDRLNIALSDEDALSVRGSKLTVSVDIKKTPDENLAMIRQAAEAGNSK